MNQAVVKNHPSNKDFYHIYLKEVPVVYASIQEPKKKFEGEGKEYCLTAFVNSETRTYLEDVAIVNKQLHEVGVGKNKLRKIKYPTSDQREDGKDVYDAYKGLYGISLTRPEFKKDGTPSPVTVVDKDGEELTSLVGNGSVCNIKCFGYKNKEGLLNMQLELVQVLDLVAYEGKGDIQDDELGITVKRRKVDGPDETGSGVNQGTAQQNMSDFDNDEDRPF
jgi:hypothetical protein